MDLKLATLYYELEARTQGITGGVRRAESEFKKLAQTVIKHPVAAIGLLAAAFTAAAVSAGEFAGEMETSMRRVGALMPAARGQLNRMQTELVELSRAVPLSIGELTAGLEQVVRLGAKDPGAALKVLTAAARGAVGTGQDLALVIKTLDQSLDAFNLPASQAARVMDLLTTAIGAGAPLAELSPILEQVGSRAQQMGVSMEQVVAAAIAMLEAGQSVRQVVGALNQGLGGAKTGADEMTESQVRLATQVTVAEGKLQLAGAGADQYAAALEGARTSSGNTDRAIGSMNDTLDFQQQLLRNQVAAAWLDFGNAALPVLKELTKAGAGFFEIMTGRAQQAALTTNLRDLAEGWRKVNFQTEDAVVLARMTELGWNEVRASLNAIERQRIFDPQVWNRFAEAIRQLPAKDLPELKRALVGLSEEQLRQVGITRQQLNAFLHAIGEQRRAVAQVLAGEPGEGGPTTTPPRPPLTQQQADFLRQIQQQTAGLTTTLVDDLLAQLEVLEAKAHEVFGQTLPAAVQAFLTETRGRLRPQQAFEELERAVEALGVRTEEALKIGSQGAILEMEPQFQAIEASVEQQLAATKAGTAEHERLRLKLIEIRALHVKILELIGNAGFRTKTQAELDQERVETLKSQARNIESAARGALQLADAFGIVDSHTAQALENIVQIAANLPAALKGDASSILSVLGGLAGALGGLFGESPEEQRRKQILRDNTAALEQLARQLGEFGKDITGSQASGLARALADALVGGNDRISDAEIGLPSRRRRRRALGREQNRLTQQLAEEGLSQADLEAIARELGITLDTSSVRAFIESLRQLQEALAQAELTKFVETFQGQMQALRAEFELFDIDDPIRQLERLRDVFSAPEFGAPALRQALAGLDLSTPEGRAAAERAVQELFRQLQEGTLAASALGGLTGQEFLDALLQIENLLDQAGQSAAAGGQTGQFIVERTITEITGSRIASYLGTALIWQEQTAQNTEAIARILGAFGPSGRLQPPTAEEIDRFGRGGAGGVVFEAGAIVLTIAMPAGATAAEGEAFGRSAAEAIVDQVNRVLGSTARRRKLTQGNVVRN